MRGRDFAIIANRKYFLAWLLLIWIGKHNQHVAMKLIYLCLCAYALVFSFNHWVPIEWHTNIGLPKEAPQERIERLEQKISSRRQELVSLYQRMGSAPATGSGSEITQMTEEANRLQGQVNDLEMELKDAKATGQ
jgi:hypothetical protein